jgi:hypothetical protein
MFKKYLKIKIIADYVKLSFPHLFRSKISVIKD